MAGPIPEPAGSAAGTETARAHIATLIQTGYGERPGVVGSDMADPMGTVTTVDHHSLVTANIIKMRGDNVGSAAAEPLHTISAQGTHHAIATANLVQAFLVKYYGTDQDPAMREPLHTVTTKDRFGLVTVRGQAYQIADIGLRMLTPRELYRAQGFPESYVIDKGAAGEPITKTAQVRMCGNSVCPPLARAIYAAPQPAAAPLSEREAFERDWEKRNAPVPINGRTRDDGRYGDSSIQDAWESWQARAALAAQGGK